MPASVTAEEVTEAEAEAEAFTSSTDVAVVSSVGVVVVDFGVVANGLVSDLKILLGGSCP